MAQQKGLVKLKGSLDDLTFVKTKDGYEARLRSTLTRERVMNDPKFARTRENGREFGRAGKSGKTLRMAFAELLTGADGRMISRLHKAMMLCLQQDTTGLRGERTVVGGDPTLLKGFDFNVNGPISATIKLPLAYSVNRTSGALGITVPAFVPTTSLAIPGGATHYKFIAGGAAVDYDQESFDADSTESTFLPINNSATTALTLNVTIGANATAPIYQVLGIHFYQDMNGTKYSLNSGDTDAIAIVNADV